MEDVLAGLVPTCRQVQYACQRHLDDKASQEERGLYFDEDAAKQAVYFFSVLRHWKGEWAEQAIVLEPWQQFIIWSLFGWKRLSDGFRRFRTAYLEVARKNGKTTMVAGIGLYMMISDGEPGAEIYTAATKRDQSKIAHEDATKMVKKSEILSRMINVFRSNLSHLSSASKFEPLAADYNSLDGLNVHCAIADELHAWKTRDLWDVLETATGSRRQPLMLAITTAGVDRESLCYQLHDYTEKVVSGVVEDDTFFGVVYTLDEGDDWEDEGNWIKANPNLRVSKKIDDMRRLAARAREMPTALNAFLRLHLDMWTQATTRWIRRDVWDACSGTADPQALIGRKCYAGLDLSSTTDLSAWVLVFPPIASDEPYKVLAHFFMPEENILVRERQDRVPFTAWQRGGFVKLTPGNVIDYDWILAQIDEDMQRYDIKELAFDKWGATRIQTTLQEMGPDDDWLVQFRQGFASMSGPSKDLERLLLQGMLEHGGHPVLTWMADNVVTLTDAADNIKPDKKRSRERIDGIVALIMALGRALAHKKKDRSKYEDTKLQTL